VVVRLGIVIGLLPLDSVTGPQMYAKYGASMFGLFLAAILLPQTNTLVWQLNIMLEFQE